MFKRDSAIHELIEDDVDSITEHGYVDSLYFILERGFKGYAHFTDEELIQELQERDISVLFGDNDD